MQNTKSKKHSLKKEKKLIKLINNSDSDEDSEHELGYYVNDRVKLMKEVLKIIKPNKIKSMAPECFQRYDNEEINSMLLEELLGISNKRLKYIFSGQNLEEDSSSTDPEEEKQSIDIISLDDISDDDFVIDVDSGNTVSKKESKRPKKKIKKEKNGADTSSTDKGKTKTDEQNLMSVLELLELQARARAIRSQLALENSKKEQIIKVEDEEKNESDNGEEGDDIIIEIPKPDEIVISSESDEENERGSVTSKEHNNAENEQQNKAVDDFDKIIESGNDEEKNGETGKEIADVINDKEKSTENSKEDEQETCSDSVVNPEDGIVINVEQSEIDCIISD